MNILEAIQSPVKRPYRRMYIKRRTYDGSYEADWFRIDSRDGINRINSWGSVEFAIDAEKVIVNTWDISQLSVVFSNFDGWFNSGNDARSAWFGYLDHKDTKLKIDVGYLDTDDTILGLTTIFEGLVIEGKNNNDITSSFSIADYSKKLDETLITIADDDYLVSDILTLIEANTVFDTYFSTVTFDPKNDVTITVVNADNDLWQDSIWQILQYLAVVSMSTIVIINDEIMLQDRAEVGNYVLAYDVLGLSAEDADGELAEATETGSPYYTFMGVGGASKDLTLYGSITYDKAGSDKLYTKIVETSTGSVVESISPTLLIEGRTKEIDLSDLTNSADKTTVINDFLARFGVKRPTIQLSSVFMNGLIYPFSLIAVDNQGTQAVKENVFIWGKSKWESSDVWGVKLGANKVYPSELFIVEKIVYNLDDWFCQIFGRSENVG